MVVPFGGSYYLLYILRISPIVVERFLSGHSMFHSLLHWYAQRLNHLMASLFMSKIIEPEMWYTMNMMKHCIE